MLIGLVGPPNHGKSTLFNALTLGNAEVSSHAFTTIRPNEGIAYVKVKSLKENEKPREGYVKNGWRFVPVKVMDVAGIVPGASEGRGLGNQFLNDLIKADALIIVVDGSGHTDEEGNPVEGYSPSKIVRFILDELDAWILGIVTKQWEAVRKKKDAQKQLAEKLSGIGIKENHIKEAMHLISDLPAFSRKLRELSKPFLVAANKKDMGCDCKSLKDYKTVPVSAVIELMLKKADEEGFISYCPGSSDFKVLKEMSPEQEKGLSIAKKFMPTGVQQCINEAVFNLLGLIVVYPVQNENKWSDARGNVLPDAYLMPKGSTALDLAYRIHTDIGEGFIRAIDARTGKVLGKNYVLKNNDIIKIISKSH